MIKDRKNIKCPICDKFFKPLDCGFTLCTYTIAGRYLDDNDGEEKFIEPKERSASGKFYTKFDSEGGKSNISYITLTIHTEVLKK